LIPINNPSNVISHSSMLTAIAEEKIPEIVPPVEEVQPPAGPEFSISIDSLVLVTTGKSIPIRMDLERNTILNVESFLDGELQKTEDFDINRRRFVYMLTPQPGTNRLRFTLSNAQGKSTAREVTVIYTPPGTVETGTLAEKTGAAVDSNRFAGLVSMAEGNLARFLQSIDLSQFESLSDLYDYLLKHAAENNYTQAEVDALIARYLSQKNPKYLADELKGHASDSLRKTLDALDLDANRIFTSEGLLEYLFGKTPLGVYTSDALREALYEVAAANHNPLSFIELLKSYSGGRLTPVLGLMKKNADTFPNTRSVADHLLESLANSEFSEPELESALGKAAADMDMNFLYQGLIFISGDSLKQVLLNLNMNKDSIVNSLGLVTYLMDQSDSHGYTKHELIDNIEKIRMDPYYYVDLFRKLLAERATGSLKVFLQEIDVRNLKINTFEELIDYLLNQSKFHDFNREMVYQLLLDIIDPKNVREFVDLLLKYGDDRIGQAIQATDIGQYSKPLEVLQYLLSVADEYNFAERDLLRVLLKMLLRKGPSGIEGAGKAGWFASINRPALVTTLIIVNSIIIILLVVFYIRKRRKNEENGTTA